MLTIIPEDIAELLHQQQRIFVDELPALQLYMRQEATLTGPGLEGVRPHVLGEEALAWIAAEWRFTAKKQLNAPLRTGLMPGGALSLLGHSLRELNRIAAHHVPLEPLELFGAFGAVDDRADAGTCVRDAVPFRMHPMARGATFHSI